VAYELTIPLIARLLTKSPTQILNVSMAVISSLSTNEQLIIAQTRLHLINLFHVLLYHGFILPMSAKAKGFHSPSSPPCLFLLLIVYCSCCSDVKEDQISEIAETFTQLLTDLADLGISLVFLFSFFYCALILFLFFSSVASTRQIMHKSVATIIKKNSSSFLRDYLSRHPHTLDLVKDWKHNRDVAFFPSPLRLFASPLTFCSLLFCFLFDRRRPTRLPD
jgi:hypothetical protein